MKMELEKRINVWLEDTSKKLDISSLRLKKWPDALSGKEDLIIKLVCYNNQLTAIPAFPKLTVLWCENNQLTSLPLLHNLTKLDCSNNQLTSLPSFPKLTELGCYRNQLTSFPILLNLTTLDCSNNQLTSLPSPSDLPKLTKLWCSHNQLTSLPLFPKLTKLWCYRNQLTSIPLFSNLIQLFCSDNQLTSLHLLLKLINLECYDNNLFSNKLKKWKKVWGLKTLRSNEIRSRGLKKVIKVLKNRLYLPRLSQLEQELVYSPNHPGKFYKNLRVGNWSFENNKPKKLTK